MSSKLTPTALPTPPNEYNVGYMDRLVKQIALEFTKQKATTPITCGSDLSNEAGFPISGLTIVNPPISSTGSPPDGFPEGSVWCDTTSENSLKIITSGPSTDQDSLNLANTTDPALGDALIGFRQSNASGNLTGAVGRTVHEKLQEIISVKDFGAVGDGYEDDTDAVHAAITYAKSKRGSVFFPVGTYRVTSGYTDNVNYQDVRLYGENNSYNTNSPGGSHIRLDSTDPASFFYRVNSITHLQIENLTFSCAQYVQDRKFIAFNYGVNSFTLNNLTFQSVEKPICFELFCYFQSGTIINVTFLGSGTIHSVGGAVPVPGGIDLRGTLLIVIDVNHEGNVPINTEKIVCDLSSIRLITADNLLLEGALPASGWTVLKLSNPYDAYYTRANFGLFNNFYSEWSGYSPDYIVEQIGGNVQWNCISGIDPACPYKISSLGSVDITNLTFSSTDADVSTYFSLEDSQCVVRLTNCAARNFDTSNTSILYRMMQIASPNNGSGQVVIDATDSSSAYKWSGGYVLADNVSSIYLAAGQAIYPSTDATYGRKLVLAPDGSGILNPNITIPAVIKTGMQVTIMARMKLPTFASGLWGALACSIGALGPVAYKTTADSGAIVDVQVTAVALADLTDIVIGFTNGTTPGATGGTVVEVYALEVFVGSQIPRRLFSAYPKNITTSNTAAPTVGAWAIGDRVFNSTPTAGGNTGWVCTTAGTPGTWTPFGQAGVVTSIAATPSYVGQIAVVAGVGYLATGVASPADWIQIT